MTRCTSFDGKNCDRCRLAMIVDGSIQTLRVCDVEAEIKQLRSALREAIDIFDMTWCPEFGHAPRPDQLARMDALRKLTQ